MVFDVARLRLVFIAPGTPKAGVLVLATVLNYSVGQECPTLSPQVGTPETPRSANGHDNQ